MATLLARARAELARREKLRREAVTDFSAFVRQAIASGHVPGITKVEWGPHLDAVCLHTQLQLESWLVAYGLGTADMVAKQRDAWERTGATWEDGAPEPWLRYVLVQNQIDNLPPGTLKSTIVMILACAWIWLHAPKFIFGAASGIDTNVTRDSNATRDLIESPWYRDLFAVTWTTYDLDLDEAGSRAPTRPEPLTIRSDAAAVSDWATSAGGRRYSRTVGRGFTGLHVDGVFIDDPDDADRVWNETTRVATQNKFTRALENRVNDEHRSIRKVMQQIVHVEGMSAYLRSIARWSRETPKGWATLSISAEYGFGPADASAETPWGWRDWRRDHGETMHPRLSAGVLADKRLKLPGYEGQYNQNPDEVGSGMFERRHARFFLLEGMAMPTRRRPDGCIQRSEMPPHIVKLGDIDRKTLSIDAANSLNPQPGAKVSAVGLVVAGCAGEERFWLDDRTRVLGVSGTYRAVFEICAAWDLDEILVELKALGAGVIAEITRSIRRGWYLDEHDAKIPLVGPDGNTIRAKVSPASPGKEDKVQRAHAWLPAWEQGLIHVMDGADWLYPKVDDNRCTMDEGMIGEVCSFPASRRKDRVDSFSQFMAENRGKSDTRQEWRAMRRLGMVGVRAGR